MLLAWDDDQRRAFGHVRANATGVVVVMMCYRHVLDRFIRYRLFDLFDCLEWAFVIFRLTEITQRVVSFEARLVVYLHYRTADSSLNNCLNIQGERYEESLRRCCNRPYRSR